MDTSVPLLVFTPSVGNKEHVSTHMKFHTGTIHFRMLNHTEVFFSFQPYVSIVGDCFRLVEELFFNRQCFISEKKIIRYIFVPLQNTTNLNLTILISILWKKTYFKSILSIAFADKAIVCFIIAIFQEFMMSKPGLMLYGKCVPINTVFSHNASNHNIHYKLVQKIFPPP